LPNTSEVDLYSNFHKNGIQKNIWKVNKNIFLPKKYFWKDGIRRIDLDRFWCTRKNSLTSILMSANFFESAETFLRFRSFTRTLTQLLLRAPRTVNQYWFHNHHRVSFSLLFSSVLLWGFFPLYLSVSVSLFCTFISFFFFSICLFQFLSSLLL
jgi:hypothetical protein